MARLWDYLSNQAAKVAPADREDLREIGQDRRRFARHRYDQTATFSVSGMVFPCQIDDISAGGVTILAPTPPVQGIELILHVPYLGEFRAEPVYVAGERAGLKPLIGAEAQSTLMASYHRRRAPDAVAKRPGPRPRIHPRPRPANPLQSFVYSGRQQGQPEHDQAERDVNRLDWEDAEQDREDAGVADAGEIAMCRKDRRHGDALRRLAGAEERRVAIAVGNRHRAGGRDRRHRADPGPSR